MTRQQKLLQRFLKSPPPADFRFDELETLLSSLGFRSYENARSSSHKLFIRIMTAGREYRIVCSRPHPGGILKAYQIRAIRSQLRIWEIL